VWGGYVGVAVAVCGMCGRVVVCGACGVWCGVVVRVACVWWLVVVRVVVCGGSGVCVGWWQVVAERRGGEGVRAVPRCASAATEKSWSRSVLPHLKPMIQRVVVQLRWC